MSDTQWPRYEVFKQDRPNAPYENVGSVHATDAEMALQNGRDIFARRPPCHSLWVVPASAIFSQTAEQLAHWQAIPEATGPTEPYLIFQKQSERRGMVYTTYVGEVEASSPVHALHQALQTFPTEGMFVVWVCPATAVTRSEEADVAPMFAPAKEKLYRMPNQYRTVFAMQKIKRGHNQESNA